MNDLRSQPGGMWQGAHSTPPAFPKASSGSLCSTYTRLLQPSFPYLFYAVGEVLYIVTDSTRVGEAIALGETEQLRRNWRRK